MRPNFRFVPIVVVCLSVACFVLLSANPANGQCTPASPPSFSASAGPGYQQVTYNVGGVTVSVRVEIWDVANSQWVLNQVTFQNGSWTLGNQPHNFTVNLRAANWNSCEFSPWVYASATTLDVGHPWINVYKGAGAVIVEVGPVYPPPWGACVVPTFSTDGENFTLLTYNAVCQNTQFLVQMPANVTYWFRSEMSSGLLTPRYATEAVRLSPDQDYGNPWCKVKLPQAPKAAGEPVNVTNGNMYLDQTDYRLPGIGEAIDITRSYNSMASSAGMFGNGWSSPYDERITLLDARNIRLAMPDGRGTYFARQTTSGPFAGITPGFEEEIIQNTDATFTLTFDDGRIHKFYPNGRLKELRDRNGNAPVSLILILSMALVV